MSEFMNIADLVDPNHENGQTYRQVNNERRHFYPIGMLVEIEGGVRLFVKRHTRDCDGTPLYTLSTDLDDDDYLKLRHGYGEESLTGVITWSKPED